MSGVGVRCMGDARGRGGKGVRRGGKQSAGGGGALPANRQTGKQDIIARKGWNANQGFKEREILPDSFFNVLVFHQHSSDNVVTTLNVPSFRILCYWSTSKMGGLDPVDSATISACLLINKTERLCVCVGQLEKAGQALLLLCLGSNSQRECLGGSAKFFLPTKVFLSDSQAVKLLLERRSVLASLSEEELGRRRRRRPACSQSSTGCAATKSDWTLAS